MSNGKSPTLWIYDHAPTRWVIVGVFVVAWFLAIVFLFSDMVKVLAAPCQPHNVDDHDRAVKSEYTVNHTTLISKLPA